MAQILQNRWVAYGALVTAICTGIAVVIAAMGDYKVASNPYARPDAFTAKDAAALKTDLRTECIARFDNLQRQINTIKIDDEAFKIWREQHDIWGQQRVVETERWRGRIETQIELLIGYR